MGFSHMASRNCNLYVLWPHWMLLLTTADDSAQDLLVPYLHAEQCIKDRHLQAQEKYVNIFETSLLSGKLDQKLNKVLGSGVFEHVHEFCKMIGWPHSWVSRFMQAHSLGGPCGWKRDRAYSVRQPSFSMIALPRIPDLRHGGSGTTGKQDTRSTVSTALVPCATIHPLPIRWRNDHDTIFSNAVCHDNIFTDQPDQQ